MDHSQETTVFHENANTELPIVAGLMAGVVGSLSIMLVVLAILVLNQRDIFTAARLIATVVYGPEASTGVMPIVVGTLIHLITGGTFGAVFAWLMPRLPRAFWIVAGLIYGEGVWLISTFIILPMVVPQMMATDASVSILLLAHVVYGFVLGIAGGTYELWWQLPERLFVQAS